MKKEKNPIDEKFKKDKLKFNVIKNDVLVCKDCKNRFDDNEMPCNTSKCLKFELKPDKVLDGEDCIEYEKE